jgi:GntR family transcriptional regulator, arabinose operon transcriptional repressor
MTDALYTRILEALRGDILSKKLLPGDRIPTEVELASQYDVSRITTTRAMKELENEGLIYRVKGKGSFVRPEGEWRRNRQRSRLISLIVPFERESGAAYALLGGAESQAAKERQLLTIHNSENSIAKERQIILDLLEHRVEGVVVFPLSSYANYDILSRLLIDRVPLVVIDRQVTGIDASFVAVDNAQSMAEVVRYLAELGHERIAYLTNGRMTIASEQERFVGYCRGMIQAGLPLREEHIVALDEQQGLDRLSPVRDTAQNRALVRQVLERWLAGPEPPTALAAVNDYYAVLAEREALAMGIDVPGRLSITGFDDLPVASHLEVPLTTVAQPFSAIGETAVSVMQRLIADPCAPTETHRLPAHIVKRESTAAPGE